MSIPLARSNAQVFPISLIYLAISWHSKGSDRSEMASSEVVISQLEFQASKTWSAQKRQQEVINVLEQYDSAVDLFDLYANSRAPEYSQFLGTFDGFDIAFDKNPGVPGDLSKIMKLRGQPGSWIGKQMAFKDGFVQGMNRHICDGIQT